MRSGLRELHLKPPEMTSPMRHAAHRPVLASWEFGLIGVEGVADVALSQVAAGAMARRVSWTRSMWELGSRSALRPAVKSAWSCWLYRRRRERARARVPGRRLGKPELLVRSSASQPGRSSRAALAQPTLGSTQRERRGRHDEVEVPAAVKSSNEHTWNRVVRVRHVAPGGLIIAAPMSMAVRLNARPASCRAS